MRSLVRGAQDAFLLEPQLAIEREAARIVGFDRELDPQHAFPAEYCQGLGDHGERQSRALLLRRDRQGFELRHVLRPALEARDAIEATDRASTRYDEKGPGGPITMQYRR